MTPRTRTAVIARGRHAGFGAAPPKLLWMAMEDTKEQVVVTVSRRFPDWIIHTFEHVHLIDLRPGDVIEGALVSYVEDEDGISDEMPSGRVSGQVIERDGSLYVGSIPLHGSTVIDGAISRLRGVRLVSEGGDHVNG